MTQRPGDLLRWVSAATEGLPEGRAAVVRVELMAHFEDAVADYVSGGLDTPDAERQALTDLGAAEVVACGFNDVHRGRRLYRLATVLCILILCQLWVFPSVMHNLDLEDLSTASRLLYAGDQLLMGGMILVVLVTVRRLFNWQFGTTSADRPIGFTIAATLTGFGGSIGLELVANSWDDPPTPFTADIAGEFAFVSVEHLGYLMMGVALIWLGMHIFLLSEHLFGLGRPLAAMIGFYGLALLVSMIAINLELDAISTLALLAILILGLLLWPMLSLVFFRAAYRNPLTPMRLA